MTDARGKGESRRRKRRPAAAPEPPTPRWGKDIGAKVCRKCGGRMYPADWIWQKYGLCVGWRCSKCKEKVMARSLPFKGLRKRALEPDEVDALGKRAETEAAAGEARDAEKPRPRSDSPRRPPRSRR